MQAKTNIDTDGNGSRNHNLIASSSSVVNKISEILDLRKDLEDRRVSKDLLFNPSKNLGIQEGRGISQD